MAVPDALRRLDEDLATGRVDADSYRRRRDELLAARLPPPAPAAGPPVPADDLADDELDAAERELGFEPEPATDPGPVARTPPVPPAPPAPPAPPPRRPVGVDNGSAAAEEPVQLWGIPVPATAAEAPPLPGTRSAAPDLRPPPPPSEGEVPEEPPVSPAVDPFPPPFRWSRSDDDGEPTEAPSPDTTQVVRDLPGAALPEVDSGPAAEPSPDRTQVVRSAPPAGTGADATQVVPRRSVPQRSVSQRAVPARSVPPHSVSPRSAPPSGRPAPPGHPGPRVAPSAPSDRTQFVPGAVPARAAGGGVAPPAETAPPWATAAARSEGLQGREVFVRGAGPNLAAVVGTGVVLVLVVGVLVLSFLLA